MTNPIAYIPVPEIGVSGNFELKDPFKPLVNPNDIYTCQGLRSISDYIALGEDPKTMFYTNYSLSDDVFNEAQKNNMIIVALSGGTGQWVYVPADYIAIYPTLSGVPYHVMSLVLGLGPLATQDDLTPLITMIKNLVKDTLGIDPDIKPVEISKVATISIEDHDTIVKARQLMVTNSTTDTAKLRSLRISHDVLLTQQAALQNYIKQNCPQLPKTP